MAGYCSTTRWWFEPGHGLRTPILAVVTLLLLSCLSWAKSVSLAPAKDNTLIQWSPDIPGTNPYLSNGQGDIFAGRTNQDGQNEPTISIRRGLIQFDLNGVVPEGMTIVGVTLTMRNVMGLNGEPSVSLHTVLQDWGEGTSFFQGGQGAPATNGDVTWLHTFYNATTPSLSPTWITPGGDFTPAASASAIMSGDSGSGQLFSWSSPEMLADVNAWISNPTTNFGWMLIGDEARGQTANRFNSRESTASPAVPPMLTIQYAFAGDYNDDGIVNALDYVVWRSHDGTATSLDNETVTLGSVTEEDYEAWTASFGDVQSINSAGHSATLPEPTSVCLAATSAFLALIIRKRRRW